MYIYIQCKVKLNVLSPTLRCPDGVLHVNGPNTVLDLWQLCGNAINIYMSSIRTHDPLLEASSLLEVSPESARGPNRGFSGYHDYFLYYI